MFIREYDRLTCRLFDPTAKTPLLQSSPRTKYCESTERNILDDIDRNNYAFKNLRYFASEYYFIKTQVELYQNAAKAGVSDAQLKKHGRDELLTIMQKYPFSSPGDAHIVKAKAEWGSKEQSQARVKL